MFPSRYFGRRYFPGRYFGAGGIVAVVTVYAVTYLRKHWRRR